MDSKFPDPKNLSHDDLTDLVRMLQEIMYENAEWSADTTMAVDALVRSYNLAPDQT